MTDTPASVRELTMTIAPALRGLLGTDKMLPVVSFSPSAGNESSSNTMRFTPGKIENIVDDLRDAINACSTPPGAIRVEGVGTFTVAPTCGQIAGRATGKVAIVTGSARGFGMEIAQHLAASGARVILGDINAEGACQAAEAINAEFGPGTAIGLAMNVCDGESLADAMYEVVRNFGGLDLLVANAGVVKVESVKTQSVADFSFVTDVNLKGYFLSVQAVVGILETQHAARSGYTSDIIQINSKSGLAGSMRNFAYSGSKFGGIGITQSIAMELVEDGIKVNSICPGNFFDGPLWSDPKNGLFVLYLESGKIPGAKTVEEVRAAYEAKTPMNRGCTTADVMEAIFYLMAQQYETGQALPVTGGQIMLK